MSLLCPDCYGVKVENLPSVYCCFQTCLHIWIFHLLATRQDEDDCTLQRPTFAILTCLNHYLKAWSTRMTEKANISNIKSINLLNKWRANKKAPDKLYHKITFRLLQNITPTLHITRNCKDKQNSTSLVGMVML